MSVVADIALTCVAVSLVYYGAAVLAAARFARRADQPPPPLPKIAPRVGVLKPLHGLTPELLANTVSFLETDYPRAEFVFGVADYEDRAAEVPVALKPRYQFATIMLSVGEEPCAANRKVAKLIRMAERVPKAEILVLSDADIAVERDYLRRVVGELGAGQETGIVTCAYRGLPAGSLASRLQAAVVNSDFAPMVMLSDAIEPLRHAFGATIAIRRAALEAIGGFRAVKDLLADDFFLGRMVAERGYRVKLSASLVTLRCEERRFTDFWHRQIRWERTYHSVRPLSLATIVTHGPFWALLLLVASGFSLGALGFLGAVLAARLAMAAFVESRALRLPVRWRELWVVPLKDLLMTAAWFASVLGREVTWGGRRFRLLADGAIREVKD